jgi:hypothetical protein
MAIDELTRFLMWCTAIKYGVLILWVLWFVLARGTYRRLVEGAMGVKLANFDALNVCGITIYKLGIILFNLVPWVALSLTR